ncbi:MAG: cupredoxin domain-containing protein [Chloroflexi bacterium]|nr:cupredoxin domain-containing protein [Chloroflexota bacterium]
MTRRMRWISPLIGVAIVALVVSACGGDDDAPTSVPTAAPTNDGTVQSVDVGLSSFKFTPRELRFAVGDTVEFLLTSQDINHDFTIRDLDIKWVVKRGDASRTERFTFDRPGRYSIICTVPGHAGAGMVGTITVE